jgi:hypothetical protein
VSHREVFDAIDNAKQAGCTDTGLVDLINASAGLACIDPATNAVDVASVRQFMGNLPPQRHTYLVKLLGLLCRVLDSGANAVELISSLSCSELGSVGIAMLRVASMEPPFVPRQPRKCAHIAIPCGRLEFDVRGSVQVRCH